MRILKTVLLFALLAVSLQAYPYLVTIDTTPLSGDYQAYFALVGNTGNTVTASAFNFDGGAPLGSPSGSGSGSLSTAVTLDTTVNPFFDDLAQNFTVGSVFSFVLNLSNNGPTPPDGPDNFSFALATTANVNLDTNDPLGTDYLFSVDLAGGPLNFQLYTTEGTNITAQVTPIPEPAYGAVVAGLLAGLAGLRRLRPGLRNRERL